MTQPVTKEERYLLKKMILDSKDRPQKYYFGSIMHFFKFGKHASKEIKNIVDSLVEKKILENDGDRYWLSTNSFLQLKDEYKFFIFLTSPFGSLIIPMIIGAIVAIPGFWDFKKSDAKKDLIDKYSAELKVRIDSLENRLISLDRFANSSGSDYDTSETTVRINLLINQQKALTENVNSLNSLLQEDPAKFVEIAVLKKDISDVKQQIIANNDAIKVEIDRIVGYNQSLINFMIAFFVAFIGINAFAIVRQSKTS